MSGLNLSSVNLSPVGRSAVDRSATSAPARPELFFIAGHGVELAAALHGAHPEAETGLIVVVGGPQYRVGSHRQFLLLARRLAAQGIPCLRFDFRGMGDSEGEPAGFEHCGPDILAAIDAMFARLPNLRKVILWGLCDGASAILLHAAAHPKVGGLVLLNPWVSREETKAQTTLRHYYLQRLRAKDFWRKLLSGGLKLFPSLLDFGRTVKKAGRTGNAANGDYTQRMAEALLTSHCPVRCLLSGNDLVAKEFSARINSDPLWQQAMQRPVVQCLELPEADHTFSSQAQRDWVEQQTLDFLASVHSDTASPATSN